MLPLHKVKVESEMEKLVKYRTFFVSHFLGGLVSYASLWKSYNSKQFIVGFLMLLFFFSACEPGFEHDRIIQNNSDFEVKILTRIGMWYMDGTDTIFSPIDTITIGKNTSKRIANEGGIGTVRGSYTDCVCLDSMPMIVYFDDSIKIFSNVNNMNHWNFRIIKENKRGGGGISECRMILTNDMLRNYTE